jgi:hypothetical protein
MYPAQGVIASLQKPLVGSFTCNYLIVETQVMQQHIATSLEPFHGNFLFLFEKSVLYMTK